jgi:citrate lyase subunit beta/citryl-CoA lyase
MPAANARALEKAKDIPADALIFDLEDAVAPDSKDVAREQAASAAASGEYGSREITIRCNGLDTPWGAADIDAAAAAGPSAIVIPKVSGAAALFEVASRL